MDIHGHGQLEKLYQQARGFQVVTDSEKPWAGWSKEKNRLVKESLVEKSWSELPLAVSSAPPWCVTAGAGLTADCASIEMFNKCWMLYVCTTQHKGVQQVVDVVRHTTKMFNNYSFRRQRIFRRGKVVFFARAEEIIREENAFRIELRTQYLI